jgi:hypothetical protein
MGCDSGVVRGRVGASSPIDTPSSSGRAGWEPGVVRGRVGCKQPNRYALVEWDAIPALFEVEWAASSPNDTPWSSGRVWWAASPALFVYAVVEWATSPAFVVEWAVSPAFVGFSEELVGDDVRFYRSLGH